MAAPTLVWFRQDFRLADNPALSEAVRRGGPVLPVVVLDEAPPHGRALGGAAKWWLHHSLAALQQALAAAGATLLLRKGRAEAVLPALARQVGAGAVCWNRRYEPEALAEARAVTEALHAQGTEARSGGAALLHDPWALRTKGGDPYQVFTPFWRALQAQDAPPRPLPAPEHVPGLTTPPAGDALADWALLPTAPDWAGGLRETWQPGASAAESALRDFVATGLATYPAARDRPGEPGTSRLSPALHWGELSPRQVWWAVTEAANDDPRLAEGATAYLRELGWREFCHHLLVHWPALVDASWKPAFHAFPWEPDANLLRAWQRGRTGYPLVDAGMRELWRTGWMHNRVRMVVASLLTKHLLQPWQEGAAWFWDTLVDADLANNQANWQWVAGSGADAAPYFRIFNPVRQSERFDPQGTYLRRWLPELAGLPDKALHAPWQADERVLKQARVRLGETYPFPIVSHEQGRARALAAFEHIKGR